jgi:large subunit ribosomal protein L17
MAVALLRHGAIRTTEPKAKELRRFVERLITAARQGTLHARRRVLAALGGDARDVDADGEPIARTVVQKLFDEIAPRYADRPGGYTRIIRLADRRIGDASRQVVLQLVEASSGGAGGAAAAPQAGRRRRSAKRRQAAEQAGAAAEAPQAETPAKGEPGEQPEAPAEQPEAEPQDQQDQQDDKSE